LFDGNTAAACHLSKKYNLLVRAGVCGGEGGLLYSQKNLKRSGQLFFGCRCRMSPLLIIGGLASLVFDIIMR
jgi:hypothetical protein